MQCENTDKKLRQLLARNGESDSYNSTRDLSEWPVSIQKKPKAETEALDEAGWDHHFDNAVEKPIEEDNTMFSKEEEKKPSLENMYFVDGAEGSCEQFEISIVKNEIDQNSNEGDFLVKKEACDEEEDFLLVKEEVYDEENFLIKEETYDEDKAQTVTNDNEVESQGIEDVGTGI